MTKGMLAAVVALTAWVSAPQSNMAQPLKFTAFAVNMNSMAPRAAAGTVEITINRWSTDEERDQLKNILRERGQDALLSSVQNLPVVGYVNSPGSLRWDLHFARERPFGDGGHMIFLLTDRPISTWEAVREPRSINYPFTLIQLQVDKNGKGVGKASVATRITQDEDGTVELENFASQPVTLNDVQRSK